MYYLSNIKIHTQTSLNTICFTYRTSFFTNHIHRNRNVDLPNKQGGVLGKVVGYVNWLP